MTSRRKRFVIWLLVLAGLVALYAVVGFLVIPPLARDQISQRATRALGRNVTLEQVSFNPFTFVATMDRLQVAGDGQDPVAGWRRATIDFDPLASLIVWRWSLGDVLIAEPSVRLVVDRNGRINFADLFSGPDQPDQTAPEVAVASFTITDGRFEFIDHSNSPSFRTMVAPIEFSLAAFSTESDAGGNFRLTASTAGGGKLVWNGSIRAAPFQSQGEISFADIALPAYRAVFERWLNGRVASGRVDVSGGYAFSFGERRRFDLSGVQVVGDNLAIESTEAGPPLIDLPHFEISIPEARPLAGAARIESIVFDGPTVRAEWETRAGLNLAALFQAGANRRDANGSSQPAPDVHIDQIAIHRGTLEFADRTIAEPVTLRAGEIELYLRRVSAQLEQPVDVELEFRWLDGPGTLDASGTLTPVPFRAGLTVDASNLELAPLGGYLNTVTTLAVTNGRMSGNGELVLAAPPDRAFEVSWTGDLAVDAFASHDSRFDEELIRWEQLHAEHVEFSLSPLRWLTPDMTLHAPQVNVLLGEDGTLNWSAAFSPVASAPGAQSTSAAKQRWEEEGSEETSEPTGPAPFELSVGRFSISDGTVSFRDQSVAPVFVTSMTGIAGAISNASTATDEVATVDLNGTLSDATPVNLQGSIDLAPPRDRGPADLSLLVDGLPLAKLEPYARHYLGYRIAQGTGRADLSYQITRSTLTGSNHLVFDGLWLGESVPSEHALDFPVQFALSVLRNSNGVIEITFPVSGDLSSPQFSFGGTVIQAARNAFLQAATAPFAVLASLFGADERELRSIEFAGGETELTSRMQTQLETMTRVLRERPALALTIHWAPGGAVDEDASRSERLASLIAAEQSRLRASRSEETVEEAAAVRSLFSQRFPDEPVPTKGEPPAEDSPSPGAPQRSMLGTLWHWLFGDWNEKTESDRVDDTRRAAAPSDVETMRARLRDSIVVDEATLRDRARARAANVKEMLVANGITASRIKVAADPGIPDELGPEREAAGGVYFALSVRDAFTAGAANAANRPASK